MLEHIVKNNEKIDDILNVYHLELEELKKYNYHVTDFYNLVAGTKIMIPLLKEEVEQILERTESFVMDYYPKVETLITPKKEEAKPSEKKPKGMAYPGILPPKRRK